MTKRRKQNSAHGEPFWETRAKQEQNNFQIDVFFAAYGSVAPYLPLYCKSLGLTATEMSIIFSAHRLLTAFSTPLVCAVADKWNCHKLLMFINTFIAACKLSNSPNFVSSIVYLKIQILLVLIE